MYYEESHERTHFVPFSNPVLHFKQVFASVHSEQLSSHVVQTPETTKYPVPQLATQDVFNEFNPSLHLVHPLSELHSAQVLLH